MIFCAGDFYRLTTVILCDIIQIKKQPCRRRASCSVLSLIYIRQFDRSSCNLGGQSFLSLLYFRISMIRRITSSTSADTAHISRIVILPHLLPYILNSKERGDTPPTVETVLYTVSFGCFGTMYRHNYTFFRINCQLHFGYNKTLCKNHPVR